MPLIEQSKGVAREVQCTRVFPSRTMAYRHEIESGTLMGMLRVSQSALAGNAVVSGSDASALLAAVLDSTSDAVFTVDDTGTITSANRALTTTFRCTEFAAVGAPWQALLLSPSGALPACGARHHLVGRRGDNSTFPLECELTRIHTPTLRCTVVTLRDVTERSLTERRIVEVCEQLQRRIGQDLHDGLGQLLTGIAFLAKGLESSVPAKHQPQAQRVTELINQAIGRVRSLARGLSPVQFEQESLESVLRGVVLESAKLFGLECRFERRDPVASARPAAIAQLSLIAREAITNAVRHGRAGRIVVTLSHPGHRSLLTIEDDGLGIGHPDELIEGLGLRSMRARASHIGGTLEVARAEVGTIVRCWWVD
jgi:signal transduction histidine kinase